MAVDHAAPFDVLGVVDAPSRRCGLIGSRAVQRGVSCLTGSAAEAPPKDGHTGIVARIRSTSALLQELSFGEAGGICMTAWLFQSVGA
jgi:hypothetical protein